MSSNAVVTVSRALTTVKGTLREDVNLEMVGHLREEKFNSRHMIFNSAGRPAGTDPSAADFLSEKK
jgi:hypothetical protein